MDRTACKEPQFLYKGALYLTYLINQSNKQNFHGFCKEKEIMI